MTANTNGASLEDCLTNMFSLIDLNGLRWKRFKQKGTSNFPNTRIDTHPILTTYAKCVEENLICTWRHEPQKRHCGSGGHGGGGSTAHSNFPTPNRASNNNTPTGPGPANISTGGNNTHTGNQQVNSNNNYELWIFGYGNQLHVDHVIGEDLAEAEDDTWESKGLSYECRTLLFRALNGLIERSLISGGYTKLGRWFVQPMPSSISSSTFNGVKSSLSFSFSFFVHGDSTVCATVDVRQHPSLRPLSRQDLATFQEGGLVRVALAPYGLNGIFNGVNHKDSDNGIATTTFIQQWSKFFPCPRTLARLSTSSSAMSNLKTSNSNLTGTTFNQQQASSNESQRIYLSNLTNMLFQTSQRNSSNLFNNNELNHIPPVVEVIVAGQRMRYPSECVFITSKMIDVNKSLSVPLSINSRLLNTSPNSSSNNSNNKRPNTIGNKQNSSIFKSNKTTTLGGSNKDKSSIDPLDPQLMKIKSDPDQTNNHSTSTVAPVDNNSPFKLSTTTLYSTTSIATSQNSNINSEVNNPNFKNSSSQLPSSKFGYTSATINPLGPTDLVKLFPTPPSLEQVSPPNQDDPNANKDYSPANGTTIDTYKDFGIDVYKPVECALMPPPTKWAALPNIIIPNSKTLPPECIYKGSTTRAMAALTSTSTPATTTTNLKNAPYSILNGCISDQKLSGYKSTGLGSGSLCKSSSVASLSMSSPAAPSSVASTKYKNIIAMSPAAASSPLADQTNKNGFWNAVASPIKHNHISPGASLLDSDPSPAMVLTSTATSATVTVTGGSGGVAVVNGPNVINATPSSYLAASTGRANSIYSSLSLPHQILFNNLNEINAIQLNLTLSDSAITIIGDHNFESCTLCVCNMTIKGNHYEMIPQMATPNSNTTNSKQNTHLNPSQLSDSQINSEFVNECTCGFSAMVARHRGFLSGLFFEDELELTNVLYDPTEMIDQNKLFRKIRLSNYSETSLIDERRILSKLVNVDNKDSKLDDATPAATGTTATWTPKSILAQTKDTKKAPPSTHLSNKLNSSTSSPNEDDSRVFVIDQLKQYCNTIIHPNSPLARILLVESYKNDRHVTTCSNYYTQTSVIASNFNKPSTGNQNQSPLMKMLDSGADNNRNLQNNYVELSKHINIRMLHKNPISLQFSDLCEATRVIITRMGNLVAQQLSQFRGHQKSATATPSSASTNNLMSIFNRMIAGGGTNHSRPTTGTLNSNRNSNSTTTTTNNNNSLLTTGLQALVMPTLSVDPRGALQMLEHLVKDDSKEALVKLNKAILMFASPLHDWQFYAADVPQNSYDVSQLLKTLQPILYDSVGGQNKLYKDFVHQQQQHIFSSRDSPTGAPTVPTPPCQGPLTWRQFHQAAGRGTEDQCEPQPIPSLLIGHHVERSHLAVSPFALKFWDKLLLEPYSPGHNIHYVVVAPDNQTLLAHVQSYFKELTNMYELMKLGKHQAILSGPNLSWGVLPASAPSSTNTSSSGSGGEVPSMTPTEPTDTLRPVTPSTKSSPSPQPASKQQAALDEYIETWLSKLSEPERKIAQSVITQLKSYASILNEDLANKIVTYLADKQPPHEPHADRFESAADPSSSYVASGVLPPPPLLKEAPQPQQYQPGVVSSATASSDDPNGQDDEQMRQTGLVVYLIDPFPFPSLNHNLRAIATMGLMQCYGQLLEKLPEWVRRMAQVQLVSLDSLIGYSRPMPKLSRLDELKSISLNVYAKCRRLFTGQQIAKSLTGFGPSAALEKFLRSRRSAQVSLGPSANTSSLVAADGISTRVFAPAYVLAPTKDKQTELGEMFGDRRERSSVLLCAYCITEDQRWLLVSATNERGEISETSAINISLDQSATTKAATGAAGQSSEAAMARRARASVVRSALRKLMDFAVSVMSEWAHPWRLVVGKLGRIGKNELRTWSSLLSKRSLVGYSRLMADRCNQCSLLAPTETASILSACLVSLEADSKLRVYPDQLARPDEGSDRGAAAFNKCPLSTPDDASVTHILVFPTSASMSAVQSAGEHEDDPLANELDGDLLDGFPVGDEDLDIGVGDHDMHDIFSNWDDNLMNVTSSNPLGVSGNSSSLGLGGSGLGLQVGGASSASGANHLICENIDQLLLQQPLALGYLVSTASLAMAPHWFWAQSSHLRHQTPVFLRAALHLHVPCVQLADDLSVNAASCQRNKSHQLDSSLTSDVLRCVLETYNSLSWLALEPKRCERLSCLPVHMQTLLQLYHLVQSLS